MAAWENPDVELLYDVNGLAERAPEWADLTMEPWASTARCSP